MSNDDRQEPKPERRLSRERLLRTLTFWLRPDFVLRVLNRFQRIAGFDRAIALASVALTATIPLTIMISSVASQLGGKDTAERIIDRYDLTGSGAEAVTDIFASPEGSDTSLGVIGVLFLLLAVLSFTRALQRLFEQVWELDSLSMRNTVNGLLWIGGFVVYLGLIGLIHAELGHGRLEANAALLGAPLTAAFLLWSGRLLTAKRVARHGLTPFAILGSTLLTLYSMGAAVYFPHLFDTYTSRYGAIGAVFAMISALFCAMVVIVGSTVAGREIHDELERIRRGEKPAEHEVRRQWDEVIAQARARWEPLREKIRERRRRRDHDGA